MLALRRLIESVKRKKLKAVLVFVNVNKGLDSVHREHMFKILKANSIPIDLVNGIAKIYEGTLAIVISPGGDRLL